jgi:hypothetical protein
MMGVLPALLLSLLGGLEPGVQCKKCKDTGLVVCPEEAHHACTGAAALRCSVAASCAQCVGTHTVPCPKCERPSTPEREAAQAANRAWLAEVEPIRAVFGRPLAHAKSAHFLLTFDVDELEVEGVQGIVKLHAGMHLYVERLEQLFARFSADLGAAEGDFLAPTQVFLWQRKDDQEKAALTFTRQSSSTESKLMGKAPVVTIFYDEEWLHEEFELHQAVVHQVSHCLLSNVWDGIWPGNIRAGWIDEGLAHAYELALFGEVRHYCYVETDTILDVLRGSWEPPVRAAVDQGTAPGFLGVSGKNTTELEPEEQPFAWSYVDFVLRAHPGRFGPLARALKARKPLAAALSETLQFSPFQFEEAWRVFVRKTYATEDQVKKKRRRG